MKTITSEEGHVLHVEPIELSEVKVGEFIEARLVSEKVRDARMFMAAKPRPLPAVLADLPPGTVKVEDYPPDMTFGRGRWRQDGTDFAVFRRLG